MLLQGSALHSWLSSASDEPGSAALFHKKGDGLELFPEVLLRDLQQLLPPPVPLFPPSSKIMLTGSCSASFPVLSSLH